MNVLSTGKISYSKDYVKAASYFKDKGILLPFIPDTFKSKIVEIQPAFFGSRECVTTIYDLNFFLKEVLLEKVDSYVLFGSGGYGVNSQAIHYYAVNEYLALFIQLSEGNVLDEEESKKERINGLLYAIEPLLEAIDKASKNIPPGQRLLVIQSDFYGTGWDWIKEGQSDINKETWHGEEGILQAIAAARKLS